MPRVETDFMELREQLVRMDELVNIQSERQNKVELFVVDLTERAGFFEQMLSEIHTVV